MSLLLLLSSCEKDNNEDEPTGPAKRTVIVYMASENNLGSSTYRFADNDTSEMIVGSKLIGKDCNLIAFIDKAETNNTPSIWKFEGGKKTLLKQYNEDFYSSDPARIKEVLEWAAQQYPAKSYGLVLWGHASAWVIESDTIATSSAKAPRKAYGRDTGDNTGKGNNVGKWINIPTLAKTLEGLNFKLDYIFADCCNMSNAETAYELRKATPLFIASPAEIPGNGAPYDKLVPHLFSTASSFAKDIVNTYADAYNSQIPLAVIETAQMEQLANATRVILSTIEPTRDKELNFTGLVYNDGDRRVGLCTLYDMGDFLLQNATADNYRQWKQAFDKAVTYRRFGATWLSSGHVDFSLFKATEEKESGMSMYIPRQLYDNYAYSSTYNGTYNKMQWYWAVNWQNYGW